MSSQPATRRTGAVSSPDDPPVAIHAAPFLDRRDAGRRLSSHLERFRDQHPVIVAIARGGVPVAAEVARTLGAPLEVTVVRKVGAPQNPEFGIGAVAEDGVRVVNQADAKSLGVSEAELDGLIARAEGELSERVHRFRGGRPRLDLTGRTAILVDDGLATGRSARAALLSLRRRGAAHVVLAVPVAAPSSLQALRADADDIVCVEAPEDMWAVGLWYADFDPTTDEEVLALLGEHATELPVPPAGASPPPDEIQVTAGDGLSLGGRLTVPPAARAVVAFAHGSGSSRLSPRNQAVAVALNDAGYATLLFDLLTPAEEVNRANVFDIALLGSRLIAASEWLEQRCKALPVAFFGASTGAAAALTAAAALGGRICAVISRGGRPDLAHHLSEVTAPTLLIVGGLDRAVLELNRLAQSQLHCVNELAIVPGATHLFEEPGALEEVAHLATHWLSGHCARGGR